MIMGLHKLSYSKSEINSEASESRFAAASSDLTLGVSVENISTSHSNVRDEHSERHGVWVVCIDFISVWGVDFLEESSGPVNIQLKISKLDVVIEKSVNVKFDVDVLLNISRVGVGLAQIDLKFV